jgi:hypothetical protein
MSILYKAEIIKHCKKEPDTDFPLPENVTFIEVDNFQGFYYIHYNVIYIYFNGSNETKDWIDNFNASRIEFKVDNHNCGKVHTGFYNYYINVRDTFVNIIKNNLDVNEIHITGYSLGGSCVIAALEASFIENCPPITVVTFGSPRVGDLTFTSVFKKRIHKSYRVVNEYDPVPAVPLPIRFKHVHGLNLLKKNYNYTSKWSQIWNTITHFFRKSFFTECHDIDNYIQKIKNSKNCESLKMEDTLTLTNDL